MSPKPERTGELLVFAATAMQGLFPLIANVGAKTFPPLLFAAVTTIIPGGIFGTWLSAVGGFKKRLTRSQWIDLLILSLCNIFLPYALILVGTQYTDGINTALLGQFEIVFSLFFFSLIFHERISRSQVLGSLLVFVGTVAILYRDAFQLNMGELLIVLSSVTYPFGNMAAKRLMKTGVSSLTLLYWRNIIGGVLLLLVSVAFEWPYRLLAIPLEAYWLVVQMVLLVNIVGKVLWFEGLKRLDVNKAVAIICSTPVMSLLFAVALFDELPTVKQLVGFAVTMLGLLLLVRPRSALAPGAIDRV